MLNPQEHARIIADKERVCLTAGIQWHFLEESMKEHCGAGEVEWVTKFWEFKEHGVPGMLLNGISNSTSRCQAIAAALIRNYIDARVIPLNTLVDAVMHPPVPSPTVLLIPNLYVAAMVEKIPAFKIQAMYDLLMERWLKSKPSVVYVEDLKSCAGVFGKPFRDFLTGFHIITD